jgi:hypothetical protein
MIHPDDRQDVTMLLAKQVAEKIGLGREMGRAFDKRF